MNSGRVVLVDPSDEDSVFAVILFTPWDQLTKIDEENLNFINPVGSLTQSWDGKVGDWLEKVSRLYANIWKIHQSISSQ
jgi:hypothetical protein